MADKVLIAKDNGEAGLAIDRAELDATLSVEGGVAEAKVTGDAIARIDASLTNKQIALDTLAGSENLNTKAISVGQWLEDGTNNSLSSRARSVKFTGGNPVVLRLTDPTYLMSIRTWTVVEGVYSNPVVYEFGANNIYIKPDSDTVYAASFRKAEVGSMTEADRDAIGASFFVNEVDVNGRLERLEKGVLSVIYGFHIDSSESDPSACVTYLSDAVGMTPAHMDFANDRFDWGSWKNAFFIPRPCMLKYDGTVDYYLDPDDYSKRADGTPSDVSDFAYGGNAMMEWGRDGKKIWYKIVPDSDPTSASVYIADSQADPEFRAWSFINNQGVMVDHFYTPIYNGTIDGDGRLRSISGKAYTDLCQSKTSAQEITAAELNNPGTDKLWYTEVYADITIINLLLILIGKSLNSQAVYGTGRCGKASEASSMLGTGTMDDKGLFWGSESNNYGVKVFGMENWWGNQWRRYAGHMMNDYAQKYKMTRGRQDGSTADDYNTTANGYLTGATVPSTNGYVTKMQFDGNGFQTAEVGGTSETYWCDYWYHNSGTRYALRGAACHDSVGNVGFAYVGLNNAPSRTFWHIGSSLSCKPLAQQSESETEG